ncbi:MAG: hypothetical protein O3A84_00735 [Proteobacteria bacterium]|nr:hypothetical protein [Pseudomonadota bacterium]
MAEKPKNDGFVDEVIRRHGQINIFDIRRHARGRGPAREEPGGRYWTIAATVSLLAGFVFEWPDIAGGARFDVIATKWMVFSGMTFFVLMKIKPILSWIFTFISRRSKR